MSVISGLPAMLARRATVLTKKPSTRSEPVLRRAANGTPTHRSAQPVQVRSRARYAASCTM